MSSTSDNYVAYAIFTGMFTYGICLLASCNSYEMFVKWTNPAMSQFADSGKLSRIWLFLIRFAILGAPIYFYINSQAGTIGDGYGRNPALAASLAVAQLVYFLNYVHNVYFYVNQSSIKDIKWASTSKAQYTENWFITYSKGMYAVNALGFMAFLIFDPIYMFTSNGWHTDLASSLLLASSIMLAVATLMVFSVFNLDKHVKAVNVIMHALRAKKQNPTLNLSDDYELRNVTPLGRLLHEKAIELDAGEIVSDSNNTSNYEYISGAVIDTNSHTGTLLKKTMDHFGETGVAIRQLDNKVYGMKATDAAVADSYMNYSMGNILKLPTIIPTSKRMYQKLSTYYKHSAERGDKIEETEGDKLLNPTLFRDQAAPGNDSKGAFDHGYVTVALNYDKIGAGYFCVVQDIWGVTSGIGFFFNLTGAIVMAYVLLKLAYYIYFISDTKYGIIIWLITTWLPAHFTMDSPAMFWDCHLQAHLVGWGAMTLANAVVSSSQFSYVYSNTVWNNTAISDTVCFGSCTDLDDAFTYYTLSMFGFIVTILVLVSVFLITLAKCEVLGYAQ